MQLLDCVQTNSEYVKIIANFTRELTMSDQAVTATMQLNTRGLRCPEPVMMLHQAIRKSKSGDVVEVFATDNSTSWDIPKFCMHLGHALLLQEEVSDEAGNKEFHYLVQKG